MAYSAIVFVVLLVGYVCASPGPLKGPMDGDTAAKNAVHALKTELEANGFKEPNIVQMSYQEADGGKIYYIKLMTNKKDRKFYVVKINHEKNGKNHLQGHRALGDEHEPIRAF